MSNVPPPNPFSFDAQSSPTANPYAAPTSQPTASMGGSDPESIRKYYISHEASVKSIGTLYILGALFGGLLTLVYGGMFIYALGASRPEEQALAIPMALAFVIVGTISVAQGITAVGLWKLKPWARIVATVLSVIGLLGFPIGTLISAYFLWLLQSEKGGVVFNPAYQDIIRQTPHVKYRTSIITWIVLGLLLLVIVGLIGVALLGSRV